MHWSAWLPFGQVAELDAQTLHQLMQGDNAPQILDVRTRLEWRHGHLAGARHMPLTRLPAALADGARIAGLALDPGRPVLAICRSAHRSIPAVRMLRAHGFDAYQLRQGMQAWWRAGLPVVTAF